MARIRTIKPEFWTSEQVMECSPLARLLFIGVWNFCDDAGNHPVSAKTLKALVFPGDDITSAKVAELLAELSMNGLIDLYEVSGKEYLHVNGWKHQKIDRPTIKHPAYRLTIDADSENARRALAEEPPEPRRALTPGREGECKGVNPPNAHEPFDPREMVAMTLDWLPDPETLKTYAVHVGLSGALFTPAVIALRSGGAWAVETPTRDIVPWFLYIAKSAGYTDADLDLPELDRLHEVYRARGDTFDMTIDDASTVKDAMNDALAAGFSELTINRGLLLPVRDELRTQFEHMYTPQNMTKGLKRQLVFPSSDDFDGVDVEYFSSITWAWETVECRWPGDLGNKVEKVKVPGISDRTRAWRIGMRRRGHQKFRNDTYRWETELDALNSGYMSYAAVADDVPGYGQSSILLSVEAVPGGIALESTEPFDWSAGGPHVIALRRQDGTLSGPWPAAQIDDYRVSVNSLDFDPDTSWDPEPPHLLFGPVNRWSYPTLVTVVNPSSGGNVTVEGMPYDVRVYQYDNSAPT